MIGGIPKVFGKYRNGSERYRNGSGGIEIVSGTSESVPMILGNVPGDD